MKHNKGLKRLTNSNKICSKKNCDKQAICKLNNRYLCKKHSKAPLIKYEKRQDAGRVTTKDKKFIKKFAEQLKKRPTGAEAIFERKLQELGLEYETQKWFLHGGIKGVFDFYIPKLFLIIEVDGGYHLEEDQQQTDAIKDFICEKIGYIMLRITNKQAIYLSIKQIKVIIDDKINSPIQEVRA